MNIKEFEKIVAVHSICTGDILYDSNALCGEIGEVANVIKKITIRKVLDPKDVTSMCTMEEYMSNLKEELGDVLFYLFKLCIDTGFDVTEIMDDQVKKISGQDVKYNRTYLK